MVKGIVAIGNMIRLVVPVLKKCDITQMCSRRVICFNFWLVLITLLLQICYYSMGILRTSIIIYTNELLSRQSRDISRALSANILR